MAQIPPEIINSVKKFRENIKSDINVKKIFIFGSYAKGHYSNNSDIDVCVIADNVTNNYLTMLQIAPKVIDADLRIEPVVFSEEEFEEDNIYGLLKEVKKYGVEIY